MPELKLLAEEKAHRLDTFIAWVPRIGVGVAFAAFIGASKLSTDPHNGWIVLFDRIGLGQWFRYFTGAMQVAGGVLLLIPRTLTLGAALLACTMIGAMAVQVFVLQTPLFAILPAILLGGIIAVWWAGQGS
jgi:putative oxidoreductase